MKEQYNWNYDIKIKTKDGTYEYEKVPLEDITLLTLKHPNYESIDAKHSGKEVANSGKKLVKKK